MVIESVSSIKLLNTAHLRSVILSIKWRQKIGNISHSMRKKGLDLYIFPSMKILKDCLRKIRLILLKI